MTPVEIKKYGVDAWGLALVLVLFIFVFGNLYSDGIVPPQVEQPLVVELDRPQGDFTNRHEGSVVITFTVDLEEMEEHFDEMPQKVVLFESDKINGLKLAYNVKESRFEGGLPPMASMNVELESRPYTVGYVYTGREQMLFVDGLMVANGPFFGSVPKNLVTGNVIFEPVHLRYYDGAVEELSIIDEVVGDEFLER